MFEEYLKRSEEEEKILSEINTERDYFESTPEYKVHNSLMNELYDKLAEARRKRSVSRRTRLSTDKSYTVEEVAGIIRKHNDDRLSQASDELRQLVSSYKNLSDDEKRSFHDLVNLYRPASLDDMMNVKSTAQDRTDLLTVLVNTCIDFLNDRNLDDIDEVHFKVDGLQDSREFNEWSPSTDATIELVGLEKDDSEYYVRKNINI